MAITTLTYEPPLRRSERRAVLDYERLEEAVTLSDEGRHLEALTKVFSHFFPDRTLPDLRQEAFIFQQGSSKVSTRIDGDDLVISVPLVKLPAGGSAIAALRYVLTKISGTGQMHQPRLRGDEIHLEYRDRLTRLHPAKVVEVLRRMPVEADDTDDWLIGQFGAAGLDRAPVAELDATEIEKASALWQRHWKDVEELLTECRRKRSMFFLNELTAYAVYRPFAALPLVGIVALRLHEAANTFNDSDEDPMKREASLAKCIKDMLVVSKEELGKSLGHVSYAISPVSVGQPAVLTRYLGEGSYRETVERLKDSGKSMDAALALFSTYTFLLARFSWSEEVETALREGLTAASGKPWRDAAASLFDHAATVAERFGDDEEDGDEDDEDEDEDESDDEDGEEGDEA